MRTRRGSCYLEPETVMCSFGKRKKDMHISKETIFCGKRPKKCFEKALSEYDFFEALPDDIVISIFCRLSSTATSPSDFVTVLSTYGSLSHFYDLFGCFLLFHEIDFDYFVDFCGTGVKDSKD